MTQLPKENHYFGNGINFVYPFELSLRIAKWLCFMGEPGCKFCTKCFGPIDPPVKGVINIPGGDGDLYFFNDGMAIESVC